MLHRQYLIIIKTACCFLFVMFFSCKNENRATSENSVFVANLDSISTVEFKYSNLFKKATAIILDNKEVALIGINKMLIHEDSLYLLDRKSQGVYVFQKDGNFVRRFGNLGVGPGEYISCRDFAINPDTNEIYIFDKAKKQNL